jgi:LDH2 family malate/lactate/ureidoglycolate dehydrogenase
LGHHDVSALPQRLGWIADGLVKSSCNPLPVWQAPAAEVWDADGSLGEAASLFVLDRATSLSSHQGVGYAVIKASNHFLAAAPYVELGAERGFMTLIWSSTDAGMAVPGGVSRQIGNNPLGYAFPLEGGASIQADLCLASSSLGNLQLLAKNQASIPAHWGRTANGEPARTAEELLKGGIEPIGGAKGYALALLGEILTGLLAGGATLDQIAPHGGLNTHSQMVLAWNLELLGGLDEAQKRAQDFRARAQGLGARLPGDRSQNTAKDAEQEGVALADSTLVALRDWSLKLGVKTGF